MVINIYILWIKILEDMFKLLQEQPEYKKHKSYKPLIDDKFHKEQLSEKEIIEPRNQQAKIWNIVSKGFALMAMLTCTVGLLFNKLDNKMLNFTEILDTDTDIKKLILKNALIRGGVSLFAMHKCNKINKETKEMYQSAHEQTRDFSEEKKAG